MATTIRILDEDKNRLDLLMKKYQINSIGQFVKFLFDYIEHNEIDLNVNFNNGTYNVVKNVEDKIEKHFENNTVQMIKDAKRLEHLISVVKNIEKEYFFPLKEQGILKVATEREMKEDLKYKKLFVDLMSSIDGIYSTKRNKIVYLVDISERQFENLKEYAR